MKVLLITVRADFGGGPEHVYRLSRHLPSEVECYFAAPDDYPYFEKFSAQAGAGRCTVIPHRKLTAQAMFALLQFVRMHKIDIIHAHGKGASMYARPLSFLSGIPCIYTFHGVHTGKYSFIQKTAYIIIERFLSCFTKAFISVSNSEYEVVRRAGLCNMKKVRVILNGVETTTVQRNYAHKPTLTVMHVSRFDYQKNSAAVIAIAEALQAKGYGEMFRFVCVGDGEERSAIEALAIKRSLTRVQFAGATTDMQSYYQQAEILISTSRWEGLPLAVMEGMSFGVVPVISDVTGNSDLIAHQEDGFLFPLDDTEQAAAHLIALYSNQELLRTCSIAAVQKINTQYSASVMAKNTCALYHEILQ